MPPCLARSATGTRHAAHPSRSGPPISNRRNNRRLPWAACRLSRRWSRQATAADAEAIAAIFAHYVTGSVVTFEETPPTAGQWRDRLAGLAGSGLPVLVAELDNAVAGYAYASPWRPKPAYRHTVEDTVYLAPRAAAMGSAGSCWTRCSRPARRPGSHQVIAVIADTGDPASVALHRRCGFTDAGRLSEVGHKHGRWVDTILLQRTLDPP